MIRHLSKICCVVALALFGLCSATISTGFATPIGAVTDARIGVHDNRTRFVLELNADVPYRAFMLRNPNRVVIDLPELAWQGPPTMETGAKGTIAGYRYGLFKPGVTRVVIDLRSHAQIEKLFMLPPSSSANRRLVLDIAPSDTPPSNAVLESVGWSGYAAKLANRQITQAPAAKKDGSGKRVVVLDPGHGGVDPGAIGRSGIYEKNIVLAMAKTVKRVLEGTGKYQVRLTRTRDIFIPLRRRYEVAHEAGAELFVSLHADSHKSRSLRGASVYTLSDKASDKEAAELANKENKSDVIAGTDLSEYPPEVSSILIDLAQQSVNESSWHFAEMLAMGLAKKIKVLRNPHRFAGFAVLKSPNVPSVLVELGYLSNKHDEANLRSEQFRERFARALAGAIDSYFARQDRLSKS